VSGPGRDDDPFARLGVEPRFDLDAATVDAAHRRLLVRLHPDRLSDPVEQAEAARTMALVNAARTTLLDDERRADALLRRLGGAAKEEDRSLPDGFLIEMMERREAMEEALAGGDPAERAKFVAWARDERTARLKAIAALLQGGDSDALSEARLEMNALRYVERMAEALRDAGHQTGHGTGQSRDRSERAADGPSDV